MKYQHGFLDLALLRVAEKARWFIRYPVAILTLLAASWLFLHEHFYAVPLILLACATALAKEVSPTAWLLFGAVWVWPSGFFEIPFSQMTFGILGQFLLSCLLVALAIFVGLRIYASYLNAPSNTESNT